MRSLAAHAIDASRHHPLPDATNCTVQSIDAVLLGAVGGEKWDSLPSAMRPEKGLLGIRSALGLYAKPAPCRHLSALQSASPLKEEIIPRRRGYYC
jgi:3-isopropylmalate dehydrogenase